MDSNIKKIDDLDRAVGSVSGLESLVGFRPNADDSSNNDLISININLLMNRGHTTAHSYFYYTASEIPTTETLNTDEPVESTLPIRHIITNYDNNYLVIAEENGLISTLGVSFLEDGETEMDIQKPVFNRLPERIILGVNVVFVFDLTDDIALRNERRIGIYIG